MKKILLISGLLLGVSLAHADLIDVGYPPPGGVTLGSSGSSGSGSGHTYSYSNFNVDPNQYSALYWGPTSVDNVDNLGDPPVQQMNFLGPVGGNTYEFVSSAPWALDSLQYGQQYLTTRMLLTVNGAVGPMTQEGSLGVNVAPSFPLFQVNGDFSATFVFQALEPATAQWIAVDDLFNSVNTFGQTVEKSVNFDFFAQPVSTPEPASIALVLAGLGLAGLRRRRV